MVDRTSGVPAYRQVADDIRARVSAGKYAPGDQLPSERDLVQAYGVSRPTIRDAIGLLRSEGVVVAEHGRGVFVRAQAQVVRLPRLSRAARQANRSAFLGDAAATGSRPSVEVVIRFEPASARSAELLSVPVETEVCVRERVMSLDGVPVQLATSRLPRTLTRGTVIENQDTGAGGVHARLEDTGHTLKHFVEVVGARMPSPREASALQLPAGTPVITVTRVAYDVNDKPLELNDMVLNASRYELTYDIPAD